MYKFIYLFITVGLFSCVVNKVQRIDLPPPNLSVKFEYRDSTSLGYDELIRLVEKDSLLFQNGHGHPAYIVMDFHIPLEELTEEEQRLIKKIGGIYVGQLVSHFEVRDGTGMGFSQSSLNDESKVLRELSKGRYCVWSNITVDALISTILTPIDPKHFIEIEFSYYYHTPEKRHFIKKGKHKVRLNHNGYNILSE